MPMQPRNLRAVPLVKRGLEGIFPSFVETERELDRKLSVEKVSKKKNPKNVKTSNSISDNSSDIHRDQTPNQ